MSGSTTYPFYLDPSQPAASSARTYSPSLATSPSIQHSLPSQPGILPAVSAAAAPSLLVPSSNSNIYSTQTYNSTTITANQNNIIFNAPPSTATNVYDLPELEIYYNQLQQNQQQPFLHYQNNVDNIRNQANHILLPSHHPHLLLHPQHHHRSPSEIAASLPLSHEQPVIIDSRLDNPHYFESFNHQTATATAPIQHSHQQFQFTNEISSMLPISPSSQIPTTFASHLVSLQQSPENQHVLLLPEYEDNNLDEYENPLASKPTARISTQQSYLPSICVECQTSRATLRERMINWLYVRYASSQNYYYTRDINEILMGARSHSVIAFKDFAAFDEDAEFLKRFYSLSEHPKKARLLTEYYKFHKDIPRIFMVPAAYVLNNFHDKKRRFDYYRIAELIEAENKLNPDRPPKGIVGEKPQLLTHESNLDDEDPLDDKSADRLVFPDSIMLADISSFINRGDNESNCNKNDQVSIDIFNSTNQVNQVNAEQNISHNHFLLNSISNQSRNQLIAQTFYNSSNPQPQLITSSIPPHLLPQQKSNNNNKVNENHNHLSQSSLTIQELNWKLEEIVGGQSSVRSSFISNSYSQQPQFELEDSSSYSILTQSRRNNNQLHPRSSQTALNQGHFDGKQLEQFLTFLSTNTIPESQNPPANKINISNNNNNNNTTGISNPNQKNQQQQQQQQSQFIQSLKTIMNRKPTSAQKKQEQDNKHALSPHPQPTFISQQFRQSQHQQQQKQPSQSDQIKTTKTAQTLPQKVDSQSQKNTQNSQNHHNQLQTQNSARQKRSTDNSQTSALTSQQQHHGTTQNNHGLHLRLDQLEFQLHMNQQQQQQPHSTKSTKSTHSTQGHHLQQQFQNQQQPQLRSAREAPAAHPTDTPSTTPATTGSLKHSSKKHKPHALSSVSSSSIRSPSYPQSSQFVFPTPIQTHSSIKLDTKDSQQLTTPRALPTPSAPVVASAASASTTQTGSTQHIPNSLSRLIATSTSSARNYQQSSNNNNNSHNHHHLLTLSQKPPQLSPRDPLPSSSHPINNNYTNNLISIPSCFVSNLTSNNNTNNNSIPNNTNQQQQQQQQHPFPMTFDETSTQQVPTSNHVRQAIPSPHSTLIHASQSLNTLNTKKHSTTTTQQPSKLLSHSKQLGLKLKLDQLNASKDKLNFNTANNVISSSDNSHNLVSQQQQQQQQQQQLGGPASTGSREPTSQRSNSGKNIDLSTPKYNFFDIFKQQLSDSITAAAVSNKKQPGSIISSSSLKPHSQHSNQQQQSQQQQSSSTKQMQQQQQSSSSQQQHHLSQFQHSSGLPSPSQSISESSSNIFHSHQFNKSNNASAANIPHTSNQQATTGTVTSTIKATPTHNHMNAISIPSSATSSNLLDFHRIVASAAATTSNGINSASPPYLLRKDHQQDFLLLDNPPHSQLYQPAQTITSKQQQQQQSQIPTTIGSTIQTISNAPSVTSSTNSKTSPQLQHQLAASLANFSSKTSTSAGITPAIPTQPLGLTLATTTTTKHTGSNSISALPSPTQQQQQSYNVHLQSQQQQPGRFSVSNLQNRRSTNSIVSATGLQTTATSPVIAPPRTEKSPPFPSSDQPKKVLSIQITKNDHPLLSHTHARKNSTSITSGLPNSTSAATGTALFSAKQHSQGSTDFAHSSSQFYQKNVLEKTLEKHLSSVQPSRNSSLEVNQPQHPLNKRKSDLNTIHNTNNFNSNNNSSSATPSALQIFSSCSTPKEPKTIYNLLSQQQQIFESTQKQSASARTHKPTEIINSPNSNLTPINPTLTHSQLTNINATSAISPSTATSSAAIFQFPQSTSASTSAVAPTYSLKLQTTSKPVKSYFDQQQQQQQQQQQSESPQRKPHENSKGALIPKKSANLHKHAKSENLQLTENFNTISSVKQQYSTIKQSPISTVATSPTSVNVMNSTPSAHVSITGSSINSKGKDYKFSSSNKLSLSNQFQGLLQATQSTSNSSTPILQSGGNSCNNNVFTFASNSGSPRIQSTTISSPQVVPGLAGTNIPHAVNNNNTNNGSSFAKKTMNTANSTQQQREIFRSTNNSSSNNNNSNTNSNSNSHSHSQSINTAGVLLSINNGINTSNGGGSAPGTASSVITSSGSANASTSGGNLLYSITMNMMNQQQSSSNNSSSCTNGTLQNGSTPNSQGNQTPSYQQSLLTSQQSSSNQKKNAIQNNGVAFTAKLAQSPQQNNLARATFDQQIQYSSLTKLSKKKSGF